MKTRARRLRRSATGAEHRLWQHLRGRQQAGCKFRRQETIGTYVVDFVCLAEKLINEADGGQHAEQIEHDQKRTRDLEVTGYRVLQFWNHEILNQTEAVLEKIRSHLVAEE